MVAAAAVVAVRVVFAREWMTHQGPLAGDPWCPQDLTIYQSAAAAWAAGQSPWALSAAPAYGPCTVTGPFLYPAWTLPVLHVTVGQLTLPDASAAVVGALVAFGVLQVLLWARWSGAGVAGVLAGLWGYTQLADPRGLGAVPGNLEPAVALLLTAGALGWLGGWRRAGPAIMALAAAIKPDHAPWILAVAWAAGDLWRGVGVLVGATALVGIAEPLLLGHQAFGWLPEVVQRSGQDETGSVSTASLLRQGLPGPAAAAVWITLSAAAVWGVVRAGGTLRPGARTRVLLAWLVVLLIVPRVKDYVWVTAWGPLLASWWIAPWSAVAWPIGEAVRVVSPEHATWVQALITWAALLLSPPRGADLAASLESAPPRPTQAEP